MRKRIIDWIFTLQSQRGILGEKERRLYTYAYGLLLNKIAMIYRSYLAKRKTKNWKKSGKIYSREILILIKVL